MSNDTRHGNRLAQRSTSHVFVIEAPYVIEESVPIAYSCTLISILSEDVTYRAEVASRVMNVSTSVLILRIFVKR